MTALREPYRLSDDEAVWVDGLMHVWADRSDFLPEPTVTAFGKDLSPFRARLLAEFLESAADFAEGTA